MAEEPKKFKFNPLPSSKLLDEKDLESVRAEAKDFVFKEDKKKARAMALENAIREERAKVDPGEQLIEFKINLPSYAPNICLDGNVYLHGVQYKFTRNQFASIREISQQAWRNDEKIIHKGRSIRDDMFGDKLGVTLSGSMY